MFVAAFSHPLGGRCQQPVRRPGDRPGSNDLDDLVLKQGVEPASPQALPEAVGPLEESGATIRLIVHHPEGAQARSASHGMQLAPLVSEDGAGISTRVRF